MTTTTKLLGNLSKGKIFVVSAPAGTGKTTLVQMLTKEFPCVVENISYTTRAIRPGEISGVHYHFITKNEFEQKIKNQEMLEYATIYGYYYGTALQSINELQKQGKHVVLVIDTQGALLLMERLKNQATFIFIAPPSLESLQQRLIKRRTDSPESVEIRLNWAKKELESAAQYDYCIVNDDLATAYQVLRSIVIAEEHRIDRDTLKL